LDWKLGTMVGYFIAYVSSMLVQRNKTLILSILPKSWICKNQCEFIFIHFKLLKTFLMFCPSLCLLNQCVQLFYSLPFCYQYYINFCKCSEKFWNLWSNLLMRTRVFESLAWMIERNNFIWALFYEVKNLVKKIDMNATMYAHIQLCRND
jgi:hypothetical protein